MMSDAQGGLPPARNFEAARPTNPQALDSPNLQPPNPETQPSNEANQNRNGTKRGPSVSDDVLMQEEALYHKYSDLKSLEAIQHEEEHIYSKLLGTGGLPETPYLRAMFEERTN